MRTYQCDYEMRLYSTVAGDPDAFTAAREHALEGFVSKRVNSCYCDGMRNDDWLKVMCRPTDEFVVIGIRAAKASRGGFGSLILARPVDGMPVYSGRVSNGLTAALMGEMRLELGRVAVKAPAADVTLMNMRRRATATWVEPLLMVEVMHQGFAVQGCCGIRCSRRAGRRAGGEVMGGEQRRSYNEIGRAVRRLTSRPISLADPTKLTAPSYEIAFSGIPRDGEPVGVTTIVTPPAWCIAAKPREPSSIEPDKTIPIPQLPACAATELKSKSIVRFPCTR